MIVSIRAVRRKTVFDSHRDLLGLFPFRCLLSTLAPGPPISEDIRMLIAE
jgi:hypothetical protein